MKGSIGDIRVNSNIWGGRQLSKCTSPGKLKLHRKRAVHEKRVKAPLEKRGLPLGPDFTFLFNIHTVTRTSTAVATVGTTYALVHLLAEYLVLTIL
jgi:hypothetical protein